MSPSAAKLWQLISPSLPVGAYSYSQALEHVIHTGTVTNEDDVSRWIGDLLLHGLARLDLPILLRVHAAWSARDEQAVSRWSRELAARRETAELRFEDLAMGRALTQLLTNLDEPLPESSLPFAGAFAVAAANWRIGADDACAGFAWAWCEAQTAAAIKLVPLGHTAGQRILLAVGDSISSAVSVATALADDEIGLALPGLAIASSLHETQYTRLFRS